MAVPVNITVMMEIQDNRGFRSVHRISTFNGDITNNTMTLESLFSIVGAPTSSIGAKLAALTNAKIVRQGALIEFLYAQEPSSESGQYELVTQQARCQFGDGNGGFARFGIPAPIDGLFLTGSQDDLIVVDPTNTDLIALQTAVGQTISQGAVLATSQQLKTPRGGVPFSQFFGGQLIQAKPRRRRVLQGA